ncbi:hypothetical protein ACQWG3_25860, partial [Salmonella enterica subsp. enterica serovar Infantis]
APMEGLGTLARVAKPKRQNKTRLTENRKAIIKAQKKYMLKRQNNICDSQVWRFYPKKANTQINPAKINLTAHANEINH